MKFRKYQANARRISGHLLWLYAAAVTVVAGFTAFVTALLCSLYLSTGASGAGFAVNRTVFAVVFVLISALIVGAGWIRLRQLSAGGHVVAESLGGRRITREQAGFAERRLLNVVEEMAIASGVRMPKVYILPETGLNAFAAGMEQRDAVIGITHGALQAFDRNELQAVIAHEFSHILNGDMRRNMQLCGCLYGLQMITMLGRLFISGDPQSHIRYAESRSLPTIFLGMVLLCIGFTGSLAAGWIQAAISRQREFLADASAVQFTRQSDGLASALYKVAVAPNRRLTSPHAAEYAHFMFESVHEADIFDKLAATHPDILTRIERLSPAKARIWQSEIRRAQTVKPAFFYVPNGAGLSDGLQQATTPNRENTIYRQQRQAEHLAENIRRICPQSLQRREEMLRYRPKHWLSAEGDSERLMVVLAALFAPAALAEAEAEWAVRFPLRSAFYRRLQQHPLPQPLHRALLEYLLPSIAALPQSEQDYLNTQLHLLLANHTLPAPKAFLWLLASAWLPQFVHQAHTENNNITEHLIPAVTEWAKQGGTLNAAARQNLPQFLHQAAMLPRKKRATVMERCRQIVIESSDMPCAAEAEEVLQIYGQLAEGRYHSR
ncbi:M48 family metalloprotease [Neisseria dentiae]|uniref:M48 family metalloprotease n=2 Tax=Neisseria dentiae TaxID=194197 RepID=UPI00359F6715